MIHVRRLIDGLGRSVLLLLLFLAMINALCGQKKTNRASKKATPATQLASPKSYLVSDTSPIRRAIFDKQIRINPHLAGLYGTDTHVDTVGDLTVFLQSKQNCDFEKAVDSNGCIIVRYTDGLTKKICKGSLTEVITPDGRRHVSKYGNMTMFMYVMPIPAPPNPSDSDTAFNWLVAYHDNLMDEISALCSDNKDIISQFTVNEKAKCNGSLYKEIEYRTMFIEEFLKAK